MIDPTGRQRQPGRPGLPCPECGALRAPDNTPSCACARRASDALRETRTAEAAAAEDFDPLRIRPYVELDEAEPDATIAPDTTGAAHAPRPTDAPRPTGPPRATGAVRPTDVTMPMAAVPADATMPLRRVDPVVPPPGATTAPPTPLTPPGSEPSTTDLRLFETAYIGAAHPGDEEARPRPRRRRVLLVATTGAVVAVVTAAGFAAGLFSYEKPTRESAAPEDVRAAVPVPSVSTASASPSASRSASPSASHAPPPPPESERPSPSATPESASPSASPSAEASPVTPSADASRASGPDKAADAVQNGSVGVVSLRRGDQGPEVTELQLRLRAAFFYDGAADGSFSGEVEDAVRNYQWSRGTTEDGLGVYGPVTRARLESETKEP
ncbi:peptidoglycan-binding domain-containing protein [Streptomyces sp. AK04-3B]|uniref:peptidoglycan-binding domain-containing protein n=1 Tax=Streptomyces sp. AK04-3B TaxID=3028650 RepID=UPI0029AB3A36|nr:peptidoglycan-binding domain-containing protein [Streptomyces sp. AK04-3B]MDX3804284.1 peptidoglycan-binding domain-containing protein [Streptomyces sp. AK04-3B]